MTRFAWRTAGESHGSALIGIVEGLPAGMSLDLDRVNRELRRRQAGYGRGGRMRIETDRIELLSGTRAGVTLGSPLAFRIANKDDVIERLPVPTNPRPGHADLAGCQKYGHRNPRDVLERASARETAARVAAAGIARQLLEHFGIEIFAHLTELGGEALDENAAEAAFAEERSVREALREASDFLSLDPAGDERLRRLVDEAKADGDTLGGVFEVRALGLPPGLGGYQSAADRLTGRLGGALLSIPAMKGVEFGLGFEAARRRGSRAHDAIEGAPEGSDPADPRGRYRRQTQRSGGLEGGMTTGEALRVRVAMKPIPTLRRGLPTVEFESGEPVEATWQRSDVTSAPAASVVGEAMVALVLTEAFLDKFGRDALWEVEAAYESFSARLREI